MKNTKIVALVATAALLVLGMAFTTFAAAKYNWYQQDGIWHCKDKNGDDITQDWAKSGSDMYYLDENGEMATETFLEVDDAYYWVDAEGKMVKNQWVKIENTEDDDGDDAYWYYFQSNGKAKKGNGKPISINGKKYMFDVDNARMLYGWIDSTASAKGDDYTWQDAEYYAGGEDDGAIRTGWQKIDVLDDREDIEDQQYWFYFGTTGKKTTATKAEILLEKSVNGKKYAFDDYGVMKAEWEQSVATSTKPEVVASISSYAWFQDAETGAKLKKGWFRVIPAGKVNATDNEEETSHWFYAKGSGVLAQNEVKTINGKKYAFNEKGEMLAGLFLATGSDVQDWVAVDEEKKVSKLTAVGAAAETVYFFGDEETDGSMKYGTLKTEIDGDDYTFLFKSSGADKGAAYNGLKGNYFYVNGAKIKADADYKYQVYEAGFGADGKVNAVTALVASKDYASVTPATKDYAVISSSGAIVKSGTKKDADGFYFEVKDYKLVKKPYTK